MDELWSEETLEYIRKPNGRLDVKKRFLAEKSTMLRLGERDQAIIKELYYGQLVPICIIEEIHFGNRKSYRKKRMSAFKANDMFTQVALCEYRENNPRPIGRMYRLTEKGIIIAEKILGKRERISRIKLSPVPREYVLKYWFLAQIRLMAHRAKKKWLYGKEVREQVYINHNIHVDAQFDDMYIYMTDENPGKKDVMRIFKSINKLSEAEANDHVIICHDEKSRRKIVQYIVTHSDELMMEGLGKSRQALCVMTKDEYQEYLARRIKGENPYEILIESLKSAGLEIVEAKNSKGLTPYIARKDGEMLYLASYCDYDTAELIRVFNYNSRLYKKQGQPGKILMQVINKNQLDLIAQLTYSSSFVPAGKILYVTLEPYKGCNMFSIDNGFIIPKE